MSKRVYDDDDGRVIAPMDLDGMPGTYGLFARRRKRADEADAPKPQKIQLTKQESRAVTGGVLKAAFLILAVYAVVFALFILFILLMWRLKQ